MSETPKLPSPRGRATRNGKTIERLLAMMAFLLEKPRTQEELGAAFGMRKGRASDWLNFACKYGLISPIGHAPRKIGPKGKPVGGPLAILWGANFVRVGQNPNRGDSAPVAPSTSASLLGTSSEARRFDKPHTPTSQYLRKS